MAQLHAGLRVRAAQLRPGRVAPRIAGLQVLAAASLLVAALLVAAPATARPAASINGVAADASPAAGPDNDRWLARDKAAHFALSCAIIGFGYHLGHTEGGHSKPGTRNSVIGISLSLGVAKELWDGTKKDNHFSLKDLAADIAGAACGALLFTRR